MQENNTHLPSMNRIGTLTAAVLLTFALTNLIHESSQLAVEIQLPGFYFSYPVTMATAMSMLAAALAASGMEWVTRGHPTHGDKPSLEHWMLPMLTTFVAGAALGMLDQGSAWQAGMAVSGLLLAGIFLAEYISIDPTSPYQPVARAGLTAVSHALFLMMATVISFSEMRLFLSIPIIFSFSGLVSLRVLHLDGRDRWDFPWAVGIGLVCTQIAAGLHYWKLMPLQFGLVLTGVYYALITLSFNLTENMPFRRAGILPGIILGMAGAVALLVK